MLVSASVPNASWTLLAAVVCTGMMALNTHTRDSVSYVRCQPSAEHDPLLSQPRSSSAACDVTEAGQLVHISSNTTMLARASEQQEANSRQAV